MQKWVSYANRRRSQQLVGLLNYNSGFLKIKIKQVSQQLGLAGRGWKYNPSVALHVHDNRTGNVKHNNSHKFVNTHCKLKFKRGHLCKKSVSVFINLNSLSIIINLDQIVGEDRLSQYILHVFVDTIKKSTKSSECAFNRNILCMLSVYIKLSVCIRKKIS